MFFLQAALTVLLYLLSGKYSEYHIIYNPKKTRNPLTINFEESYIILYGFFKFKKKKIYIKDISVENSTYVMQSLKSKYFPLAALLGSKEFFSVKLKNGKLVNIINKQGVLSGATYELIKLTKVLKIKYTS